MDNVKVNLFPTLSWSANNELTWRIWLISLVQAWTLHNKTICDGLDLLQLKKDIVE